MRRRTKKNVRRHGGPRRAFDDDALEVERISPVANEEIVQEESPPPGETTEGAPAAQDAFEAFLARYTPPKPRRSRVMHAAIVVSILLHLSTVTLFSIVIYFPREDVQYYDFRFVPVRSTATSVASAAPRSPGPGQDLRLGSALEGALGGLEPPLESFSLRPQIQLPTLETATLDRLRIRQETLEQREAYARLFGERPQDSWSRLGEGIGRLRDALAGSEETTSSLVATDSAAGNAAAAPTTFKPADGYIGLVIWDTPDNDRDLLFSPPIRALYNLDGNGFQGEVEVVFEVNGGGRVSNVWSPTLDDSGLVDDVQATILQFRFEPAQASGRDTASGVIRIRREASRP